MGKPGLCVWRGWINHVSFGNEPSRIDVGKTPMLWGCCRCKCDSILNNTWMDVGRWCPTLAQSVSGSAWHISLANYGCFTLVPAVKSLMSYQSSTSFFMPVSFAFPACNIFIAIKLLTTSGIFLLSGQNNPARMPSLCLISHSQKPMVANLSALHGI